MKISIGYHYETPGQKMAVPNIISPCRALETTAIRIIFRRFYKQKEFGSSFLPLSTVWFFLPFPYPKSQKMNEKSNACGNVVPMLFYKFHPFQTLSQNCENRLLASSCLFACLSVRPSVCLSLRPEQPRSHWADYNEV